MYHLQDEGVPIARIVAATKKVLTLTTPAQQTKLCFPLDAPEWRAWSNPEILISPNGLRLEELSPDLITAILAVLEATFSLEGYQKALAAMRINHFLGEVCEVPHIMNEYSYNFLLFGTPSTTEAWGWSFYGHHLCLNVFLRGPQIVVSPTFTGAEPNMIDDGPYKGTRILYPEEELGLRLMQSLGEEAQSKAQIYKEMHDPAMPEGRWNKDDQRHLCGAFRDNRVVPYEGIVVSDLSPEQQSWVTGILEQFTLYLPKTAQQKRIEQAQAYYHTTYFSWIGGYGNEDPFYYRIQSPVIVVEFDHHSGVFLNNEDPAKFHTHTILRTPNGGDYGMALRDLKG